MKPETGSNKFSTSPAVIIVSAILIVVAVALWWTITVLAVLLITIAVVLIIPTLCSGMLIPPQEEVRVARTKRDKTSGIDIERILKFETGIFEARKKKQNEPKRSITAHEFLSEFDLRIPLDVLDDFDEKMKKRLRKSKIEDVSTLSKADAKYVATRSNLDKELCQRLIADAKGIIKGARISSIFDLAMADPDEVLTKVTKAVNAEIFNIPDNHNFTLTKIASWISRANDFISTFDADEMQKLIEKQDK